jgi:hypothetical protein
MVAVECLRTSTSSVSLAALNLGVHLDENFGFAFLEFRAAHPTICPLNFLCLVQRTNHLVYRHLFMARGSLLYRLTTVKSGFDYHIPSPVFEHQPESARIAFRDG